jgi:penicillin-binding protein 1A
MVNDNKTMDKKTTKTTNFKKKFLVWFWGLLTAGILAIVLVFWMITKGWLGYLPPLEDLQNPKNKYATEVISADMQLLGRYYRNENRVSVDYTDISPNMINALIATEDARFYDHTGVDLKSLMRAIMKLGRAGGGSTITQQLAKQLWSPRANNIFARAMQKPIEWVIATKLERLYSKEEILTMYLNQFDFLYNAVGIKSAAQVYFSTTPAELKLEEAAMLVGMCKNPSLYNPRRRPENALNRRNTVLNQMEKYNYITEEVCDSLKAMPIELKYQSVDHKQGIAPYLREYLRQVLTAKEPKKSNYSEWNQLQYEIDKRQWEENPLYGFCNKNSKPDGTPYDLYHDGLRIYTTIDSRMQRYAEEAVNEHMQALQKSFFREKRKKSYAPFSKDLTTEEIDGIMNRSMRQTDRYREMKKKGMSESEIRTVFNTPVSMRIFSYDGLIDTTMTPMDSIRWNKHFLRCGFMSMDAHSGAVKAYVGGPNFSHFQYDMVTSGRRQVGSTIKPYLFTLAMDEGMWPCDSTVNDSITLIDGNGVRWTPRDEHLENQGEMVTLNWGLEKSSNWITAYLMSLYTPEQLVRMMRSFGIEGQLDPVVSLCLGPCEVSVKEMVDAYTTFPNKGIRVEPLYVTRIEDNNGNVLATFTPKTYEIISETTSYKMIYMLRNVMDHGTGVRARFRYGLKSPMGGKTGTSQNHSDGWFVGFTPSLVSGVWVGGEDRSIHFDNMSSGQGANMALPIWSIYMQKVLADEELGYDPQEQFDVPEWFDPEAGCK